MEPGKIYICRVRVPMQNARRRTLRGGGNGDSRCATERPDVNSTPTFSNHVSEARALNDEITSGNVHSTLWHVYSFFGKVFSATTAFHCFASSGRWLGAGAATANPLPSANTREVACFTLTNNCGARNL